MNIGKDGKSAGMGDKMKGKNIEYEINFSGKEPEFSMKIGFDALDDVLLSIAHRQLSNRGSGIIRHLGNPNGTRIFNGKVIDGIYEENKKDARIFHDSYEEHVERLKLKERGKDFVMISNGNLGNNYWNLSWQNDEQPHLYCLRDEHFLEEHKRYSCFIVPKNKKPHIGITRFFGDEDIYDDLNRDITDQVDWANYGPQIVRNNNIVPIEEIIEQFYDIHHIFDFKDFGKTDEEKRRAENDKKVMNEIYRDYPNVFKEKLMNKLKTLPRAKYYHSTLGVDENGIVLYHHKDTIEEIAKRLVDKGVKDSIVLDQGGSVGVYASWIYPKGGFLSSCSYFRPERISTIAFVLK